MKMERKPDNGAEIHNSSFVRSGIMMRLRILKSAKNEEDKQDYKYNLPHGTIVLKELGIPWADTDRIVCSDS